MNKKNCIISVLLGVSFLALASCCHMGTSCLKAGDSVVEPSMKNEVYHAVLPCASCPGIDTWIEFYSDKEDRHFRMVERYLEQKENAVFVSTGDVTTKGDSVIQLQREDEILNYLVGDGYIAMLKDDTVEEGAYNFDYRFYKMPISFNK